MARPVAEIEVALDRTTIILALDVSRSMCATDVDPNRLTVPALAFVDEVIEASYCRPENAYQLPEVFLSMPSLIMHQKQDVELTLAFSAAGAVLALLMLGL